MKIDRRSRYFGLSQFYFANRFTASLRPIEPLKGEGRYILHQLSGAETLDQLSLHYYGRDDLWWRIADANPGRFPLDWKAGDIIRIPSSPSVRRVP